MDEKTATIYAITKALAYQENGGKPTTPKAGKSGELKSIFQFEPGTWEQDAKIYLGDANAPITPDNETTVVTKQVSQWLDEGKTVKQIASMWNAGQGNPDAYTGKFSNGQSSKGINKKYGVPYDVPTYANNVSNYAKQFYKEDFAPKIQTAQVPTQPTAQIPAKPIATTPAPSQPTPGSTPGLLTPSSPPIS